MEWSKEKNTVGGYFILFCFASGIFHICYLTVLLRSTLHAVGDGIGAQNGGGGTLGTI